MIFKRCLWYSAVFCSVFVLACLRPEKPGGFWSQNQFLPRAFAGVALVIGCGDGLYLWMIREREYGRKRRSEEAVLIRKARRLNEAQANGLIDLEEKCAAIPPLLKMSLAKEACCLAGRTGVSERVAILALANQFEMD